MIHYIFTTYIIIVEKEYYFRINLCYNIIIKKGMMILKKKTLACAALLSGAIVGFVGVTAIDLPVIKAHHLIK